MTITNFEFEDASEDWRLHKTSFNDRLTLLVGASGVGKTLILRALFQMKQIARGDSIRGIKWNIEFIADQGKKYQWKGAFQNQGESLSKRERSGKDNSDNFVKIEFERLSVDGKQLVKRDSNKISFEGTTIPKLPQEESIIRLLMEEDSIKPAYECLDRIGFVDHSDSPFNELEFFPGENKSPQSLEGIRKSTLSQKLKLYFLQKVDKKYFNQIKESYISIFPQVRDIRIAPLEKIKYNIPVFFKDTLFVQIQEEGVDHWIEEQRISSGMLRVLLELSEIYLCPEGTILLIDEFENSLGINCIKEITDEIIEQKRALQFIITSHHPYIINNIDTKYWKLVTRNGGDVKTHSLHDLGVDFQRSHHDTFMQLLQLEEFQTGQEQKR